MVLKLPELVCENQDWKIYCVHILDSTATEGVVSHLSGATPKPVDSHELEAWNSSNAVAKYIILEVITDSLLERLMHHKLAQTLFSHLAAIFGDHNPIAIEPPAERNHKMSLSVRTCTQSRTVLTQRTPQNITKNRKTLYRVYIDFLKSVVVKSCGICQAQYKGFIRLLYRTPPLPMNTSILSIPN